MHATNTWNVEPSADMLLAEPIIQLLMKRDGIDTAILRRLRPQGRRQKADQPFMSAATPGRVLPSSHSRNAPPAVET